MSTSATSVTTTNPVLGASSSSVTTTTTSSPIDEAAKERIDNIERCRKRVYATSVAQLVWGIIGMFIAFNWISNILTLSAGAVGISAWRTLTDSLRYFDRYQIGCCDPGHTKGLCIAIIVFSILELISFGAVWPIGAFYIALANVQYTDGTTDSNGSSYAIPLGARSLITWIGLCIVAAVVWAAVNLILAIVQMCFTDALLSAGAGRVVMTAGSTQVTVVAMQPQGGMQMNNGQPMMMMVPANGPHNPYSYPYGGPPPQQQQQYHLQQYQQQPPPPPPGVMPPPQQQQQQQQFNSGGDPATLSNQMMMQQQQYQQQYNQQQQQQQQPLPPPVTQQGGGGGSENPYMHGYAKGPA